MLGRHVPAGEHALQGNKQNSRMKLGSFDSLVHALDRAGVRYLVAGGLAVNAHGYLRFTLWSEQHRDTPIDLFVTEPFDFKAEYDGVLIKPLGSIAVRFVSIPALIRMKELAGRPQDKIDIEFLRKLADGAN